MALGLGLSALRVHQLGSHSSVLCGAAVISTFQISGRHVRSVSVRAAAQGSVLSAASVVVTSESFLHVVIEKTVW